jgi:hypothetical protein
MSTGGAGYLTESVRVEKGYTGKTICEKLLCDAFYSLKFRYKCRENVVEPVNLHFALCNGNYLSFNSQLHSPGLYISLLVYEYMVGITIDGCCGPNQVTISLQVNVSGVYNLYGIFQSLVNCQLIFVGIMEISE